MSAIHIDFGKSEQADAFLAALDVVRGDMSRKRMFLVALRLWADNNNQKEFAGVVSQYIASIKLGRPIKVDTKSRIKA